MSPHRIATWEQAIVYMFDGTAEVLEIYDATVSSPSVTLEVPAVMRLRKAIRAHKNGIKFSRMRMHFKPYVPKSLPISMPFLFEVASVPPQWIPYVPEEARSA